MKDYGHFGFLTSKGFDHKFGLILSITTWFIKKEVCRNEYLFTVTGVKKIKWFLSLTTHIVTEGHEWLEMVLCEK